ncbi:histidine triad nucleotide-binding protein [Haloglycomyces albus]|uniref:histidine triad nucleotide-binding protein n=1 Tax=Haloglycomyces albus TaxID=526067 RepID=UPI00046CB363|nr:histidine triad nucleotide-binding protein [Haloglycomyces albus]
MNKEPDCIFCSIIAGDIPSTEVATSEHAYAFRDLHPAAPSHIVVVPKRHHPNVNELSHTDPELTGHVVALAAEAATKDGLDADGWRLLTNTGEHAGQTVQHVHFHVLGGERLGPLNAPRN